MAPVTIPANWQKFPDNLPPEDFNCAETDRDVSLRVLVKWRWKHEENNTKEERPLFARYYYDTKIWVIEGISGLTEVLGWMEVPKWATNG